jgi:hypothetical protein
VVDQGDGLGGWLALDSPVFAAVGGPCDQTAVAEFPPQEGVVAEQMDGADPRTELGFGEGLPGWN